MKTRFSRLQWGCLAILCLGILTLFGLYAAINVWPSVGARGADVLRGVIGNEAVARLETVAFQARDTFQRWKYSLGIERPVAPWQPATVMPTPSPQATLSVTSTATQTSLQGSPVAAPTPTPTPWRPSPVITPLGTLKGEGVWTAYIQTPLSQTVAYRTFLQPDKDRPYSIVAMVAFDLTRTRLHYVLGSQEPSVPKGPRGSGKIAPKDQTPGVLLAAFNGGFKATHGHYGAMADGVVALPPRDGFATTVIYDDGSVSIGEWGRDIVTQTRNMVAWRENGPLIVQDGKITPKVERNLISDWGGTIDGKVVTWRSALGISKDDKTLYYFAGPNLSMPALARAIETIGAYEGMLLDINAYWVHFTAIRAQGGTLTVDPLLPEMKEGKDRYLHPSPRDFFYITLN